MKRKIFLLLAISLLGSLISLTGCGKSGEQEISKKVDELKISIRIIGFMPSYDYYTNENMYFFPFYDYYNNYIENYLDIHLTIQNIGKKEEYIRDVYIIDSQRGKVYEAFINETVDPLKSGEIYESEVLFNASELPLETDKLQFVVQYGSLNDDKIVEIKLPRLNSVKGAKYIQIAELSPIWEKKINYELASNGNVIYLLLSEPYSDDHIIAVDVKSGTTIWEKDLSDAVGGTWAMSSCNYIGTDGSYLYFYLYEGIWGSVLLQAVEIETGETVWYETYDSDDLGGDISEALSYQLTEKGIKIIVSEQSLVNKVKYNKLLFTVESDFDNILRIENFSSEELIWIKYVPGPIKSLEIQKDLLLVHGYNFIQVFDLEKFPQP